MDMSGDNVQKGKEFHLMKMSRYNDKKNAYICNKLLLQNPSSTFFYKNESVFSALSNLSCSPMAYHTTASLNKLTCTNYVDFQNCQDRFGPRTWMNNSNWLTKWLT